MYKLLLLLALGMFLVSFKSVSLKEESSKEVSSTSISAEVLADEFLNQREEMRRELSSFLGSGELFKIIDKELSSLLVSDKTKHSLSSIVEKTLYSLLNLLESDELSNKFVSLLRSSDDLESIGRELLNLLNIDEGEIELLFNDIPADDILRLEIYAEE